MPSPGITAGPAMLEGAADTKSRQTYKLVLRADRAVVPSGVQIVPLDITLDDEHKGELFGFLLQATPPAP